MKALTVNLFSQLRQATRAALLLAVAAASIFLMSPAANAQTLKVAVGSAKGTYARMFAETQQFCGNDLVMTGVNTNGSNDNVDLLADNQVNAAFVQSDVLYLRARTDERLGAIKTLVALHSEQVHFVAPVNSGIKVGGKLGTSFGATDAVVSDISQLGGLNVGAAGGSLTTAQVVRLQSEIPYNVVRFESDDQVEAALKSGQINVALFVGGQRLPRIDALGAGFKLLSVSPAIQERLKGVYRTARLNYPKLGAAGVPTVATDALFVTREYKTSKVVESLARFRSCMLSKIDEIKETTGTAPAWQSVDAANRGKWAYLELPSSAAAKK